MKGGAGELHFNQEMKDMQRSKSGKKMVLQREEKGN